MPSTDWVVLLQITLFCLDIHPADPLKCMYSNPRQNDSIKRNDRNEPGNITVTKDGMVIQCLETDYCYVFWYNNTPNETSAIQGCWNQPGDRCSDVDCISNEKPPRAKNNSMFCCCSTDLCNWNYSNGYNPPPPVIYQEPESSKRNTLTIALMLTSVLAVVVIVIIVMRSWYLKRKPSIDSLTLIECPPSHSPPFIIDNLKIDEVAIGRGRYGWVCRGTLNGNSVAVKIFSQQNKQYFANERDIYTLPEFQHPSIVDFIGAGERLGEDGRTEYLIVLSHAPLGCLNDFLSSQTIDWPRLCKMTHSLACGLTHLHTEIVKDGNVVKPCIAHRDLSSKNVLIGPDGGCMICDFGFAIKIKGGKYYHNGELKVAETTSLADVGTLRYMAPEVLEGAVNLRDCESSLKQADVYSFGLVLWEIATRCSDLYQGMAVPPYQLAYEKEVGLHPTMERMQVLVTNNKARPLLPDIWKDNNPAIRALKDTIVECWDSDAEARLTSLCAETRLKDLQLLWERYKGCINSTGVIPKVNDTATVHQPPGVATVAEVSSKGSSAGVVCQDLVTISERDPQNVENRSSSDNTSETSITMSPCDSVCIVPPVENLKNNVADNCNRVVVPSLSVPLQPYQGRNPSIERNLMKEPAEDFICTGNTLLQKEPEYSVFSPRFSDHDVHNNQHHSDHHDINDLVPSNTFPYPNRAYHPIQYVRNAAHINGTIPKQHNTPDNREVKSQSLFGFIVHKLEKRCEPSGKNSLKEIFDRGRTSREFGEFDEERVPLSRSNCVAAGGNNGVIGYNASDYKNLIAHNQTLQQGCNRHMRSPAELRNATCIQTTASVPHSYGNGSIQGKGVRQLVTEKLKKSLSLNSNGVKQVVRKAKNSKDLYLNGNINYDAKPERGRSFLDLDTPTMADSRRYCNGDRRFRYHTPGFDTLSAS